MTKSHFPALSYLRAVLMSYGARMAGYEGCGRVSDESLPADFFVGLTTPKVGFLNGKFVFSN